MLFLLLIICLTKLNGYLLDVCFMMEIQCENFFQHQDQDEEITEKLILLIILWLSDWLISREFVETFITSLLFSYLRHFKNGHIVE